MKALTLHQPHALLVGLGVKPCETRSWSTNFRGLLAIHAARIQNTELDGIVIDQNARKPKFRKPFDKYLPADWTDYFGDTNHGGIECLVVVEDCDPAPLLMHGMKTAWRRTTDREARKFLADAMEFGDFSEGRFAWKLRVMLQVSGNVCGVVRGYQGLWNLPEKTERELLAAYRKTTGKMICRVCGCTDDQACLQHGIACHWHRDFLCSACAKKAGAR